MGQKRQKLKNTIKAKVRGLPKLGGAYTNMGDEDGRALGAEEGNTLEAHLALHGLRIVAVTGDGNCFFRAIADQLEGDESQHTKYRKMVVDFLEVHREDYEPFMEDDVPFDDYCINMRRDGTWAGHIELQATSLLTKCNICIHRFMFPRWQIWNFQSPTTPILHLSYHGEEHYNSVRQSHDDGVGPAKLTTVEMDAANIANTPPPAKDRVPNPRRTARNDVKMVMAGTGCTDSNYVAKILEDMHGDAEATIEFLIAEQSYGYDNGLSGVRQDGLSQAMPDGFSPVIDSDGKDEFEENSSQSEEDETNENSSREELASGFSTRQTTVFRNKACPCGSGKKYKSCHGAAHHGPTVLSSARLTISNRLRKEKERFSKKSSETDFTHIAAVEDLQLGSLCI